MASVNSKDGDKNDNVIATNRLIKKKKTSQSFLRKYAKQITPGAVTSISRCTAELKLT